MGNFSQEQADALAEALRRMASKIERGYLISERQKKIIINLSEEILFARKLPKTEYKFKIVKPNRTIEEEGEELE